MRLPLTSTTSEGAQAIFSKNTFLKSEGFNKKDELSHGFLVNIFNKTLCAGAVVAEGKHTAYS